ncbi:hypothetical protein B7486_01155 [cyanobacterium TDX16]|nr:hypothetical protein B7486_01155 [cyanobacterium TDX16]
MVKRLLIVDDDSFSVRLLEKYLASSGYEIHRAANGKEALHMALQLAPDIVITDWVMPEMDGLALAKALRQHEGIGFTYVVMVTAQSDIEDLVEAFESGVDDFLKKPINRTELTARLRAGERIIDLERRAVKRQREIHRLNAEMAVSHQKLEALNNKLNMIAVTDELTGLLNRREAISRLKEQWENQNRYKSSFSIVAMDIDHFKQVNDTYGHAAGDLVLKSVAQCLRDTVRTTDIVCRTGGEEFLVICPNVGCEGGATCAEHIRASVAAMVCSFEGVTIPVTISAGVAERTSSHITPDDVLVSADKALYESKRSGRNRVTIAEAVPTP